MKKCPYCAEEIQEEAIKCKHCGEVVNGSKKINTQEVIRELSESTQKAKKGKGIITRVFRILSDNFYSFLIFTGGVKSMQDKVNSLDVVIVNKDWWVKRFSIFQEHQDKFVFTWNWPAFLVAELWYFKKGMWLKGLTYAIARVTILYCSPHLIFYIIFHIFIGIISSYDYYLYRILQRLFWGKWFWAINYDHDLKAGKVIFWIGILLCIIWYILLIIGITAIMLYNKMPWGAYHQGFIKGFKGLQ